MKDIHAQRYRARPLQMKDILSQRNIKTFRITFFTPAACETEINYSRAYKRSGAAEATATLSNFPIHSFEG